MAHDNLTIIKVISKLEKFETTRADGLLIFVSLFHSPRHWRQNAAPSGVCLSWTRHFCPMPLSSAFLCVKDYARSEWRVSLMNLFCSLKTFSYLYLGCRDGAVVRALASHQCGPGLIPRSGVKCGLSLLVLFSAPRGFLRVLRFPLSSKTKIWLDCVNW